MQKEVFARRGLVTGCGKGIGLSCLKKFLESDESAIGVGISRSQTKSIIELQEKYQDRFIFKAMDICNYKEINAFVKESSDIIGNYDFAILNAGIRSRISIEKAKVEDYRRVIEVNTISNINLTKLLVSLKKNHEHTLNILYVSSIVGIRGFDELSTYGVSKAALDGFVKSSAIELARSNILVNSINPGFTKSSYADSFMENKNELYQWTINKTPLARWAECEEIAKVALFLVSEHNTYMTGSTIYCDGGWTAQ